MQSTANWDASTPENSPTKQDASPASTPSQPGSPASTPSQSRSRAKRRASPQRIMKKRKKTSPESTPSRPRSAASQDSSPESSFSRRQSRNKRSYAEDSESSDDPDWTETLFKGSNSVPKKDRGRNLAHLEREMRKHYHREYRAKMSDQKKDVIRDQGKVRMRRYRERQRLEESMTPQTRTQKERRERKIAGRRAKWREEKQLQSTKETADQRANRLRKRREKYRLHHPKYIKLPNSPAKFADAVLDLMKGSPAKRDAFSKKGVVPGAKATKIIKNIKKRLKMLKGSKKKKDRKQMVALVQAVSAKKLNDTLVHKMFDCRIETWQKYCTLQVYERATRKDAVSSEMKDSVENEYKADGFMMGGTKHAQKGGEQKVILTSTIGTMYNRWQSSRKREKKPEVSLSKFRKLRPPHVLTMGNHKFRSALCETCLNVSLKIASLKKAIPFGCQIEVPHDKYELSDMSMCEKEGTYHQLSCIKRTCSECGVEMLKSKFEPLVQVCGKSQQRWLHWENRKFAKGKKRSVPEKK